MPERDSAPLSARRIREATAATLIGREIIVVDETSSTNDSVLALAASGAQEGVAVFAEAQTAGRGQHGNRWHSAPRQGLWFSVLLHPQITLPDSARMTTWLARSIKRTIESQLALPASIKAPNDVYIATRKVAGVLVEMRAATQARHFAIAGIGINVNQGEEDFPEEIRRRAASLAMFVGAKINREQFAVALLRELDRNYAGLFG